MPDALPHGLLTPAELEALQFIFSLVCATHLERWRQGWSVEKEVLEYVDAIGDVDLTVIMYPLSKTSIRKTNTGRDAVRFLPFNAAKRYRFQNKLDDLQPCEDSISLCFIMT